MEIVERVNSASLETTVLLTARATANENATIWNVNGIKPMGLVEMKNKKSGNEDYIFIFFSCRPKNWYDLIIRCAHKKQSP